MIEGKIKENKVEFHFTFPWSLSTWLGKESWGNAWVNLRHCRPAVGSATFPREVGLGAAGWVCPALAWFWVLEGCPLPAHPPYFSGKHENRWRAAQVSCWRILKRSQNGSLCSSAPILRGLPGVGSADDKKEGTPTARKKSPYERNPACAQGRLCGMEQQSHWGCWLCFLLASGLSQKALGRGRVGDVLPH